MYLKNLKKNKKIKEDAKKMIRKPKIVGSKIN